MTRKFSKIVYETWDLDLEIEEAIATNTRLLKTYYLDDGRIGRVDKFQSGTGLSHVSYREIDPPYEQLLECHSRHYPGVECDIWTSQYTTDDEIRVIRIRYYDSAGILMDQREVRLDKTDRIIWEITLSETGEKIQDAQFVYNDRGEHVLTRVYNPQGELLYECNPNK